MNKKPRSPTSILGGEKHLSDLAKFTKGFGVLRTFSIPPLRGATVASRGWREPRHLADLPQNPGTGHRGAADHHAIASGPAQEIESVIGCLHVAVTDDGDLHSVAHSSQIVPAGEAASFLGGDTRMDS